MSIVNQHPVTDVRKLMSGKNGALYDGDGNMLVSIEGLQAQASVTNQTFQPLGSVVEMASMTSMKFTLTFTEIVVEDSKFFRDIVEGMASGVMPVYNFRGVMYSPYDGSEEQVVYRDCVPDGTIDIQNMAVGELYKRAWSFVVNQAPDLQSMFVNR